MSWQKNLRYACCCEPTPGDYDTCSDDEGIGKKDSSALKDGRHPQQQKPRTSAFHELSSTENFIDGRGPKNNSNNKITVPVTDHRDQCTLDEDRYQRVPEQSITLARAEKRDEQEWIHSLGTDVTTMNSPMESIPAMNEKKAQSTDASRGRRALDGMVPRDGPSGVPPRVQTKKSRWTDDVLEGFLYSTLVDGNGLVLDKLDSNGSGKKSGVRVLSFDPDALRLNWISTGLRRKPGSMLVKDIDEVICEGTSVTIVFSETTATGAPAPAGRRRSLSPFRRASMSPPAVAAAAAAVAAAGRGASRASSFNQNRRWKTFSASQERDAQILKELLLFVRRKALAAFSAAVSGATAFDSSAASTSRTTVTADAGEVGRGGGGGSRGRGRSPRGRLFTINRSRRPSPT